jgi:hypothetical protein
MLLEHQKFCSHISRISTLRVNYLALALTIFKPKLPRQECENVNGVIKDPADPVLRGWWGDVGYRSPKTFTILNFVVSSFVLNSLPLTGHSIVDPEIWE